VQTRAYLRSLQNQRLLTYPLQTITSMLIGRWTMTCTSKYWVRLGCRFSLLAVGTYPRTSVWVAFVVDHVRSMAVTASAWQSLVVAWGNPSNFIGTVTFPLMTVPLTGLGEFSSSVLQLTCRTIYRIVPGASILFLVRMLGSNSPLNLDSPSLLGGYGPYERTRKSID
jgi:hypothetical protein